MEGSLARPSRAIALDRATRGAHRGGHGCHRGQMAETTWGRWEMVDLEDSYGENLRLYWLVVWNMNFMTFHFLEIIIVIPTDFHIFQRG